MTYSYEDKLNFIVSIYCAARSISFETGLSWKTMLAQAAQETGWGEKVLAKTNNIFNIKADASWKGKKLVFRVPEDTPDGKTIYVDDPFRVYDHLEDAFRDRVAFLKQNPRYAKLFGPNTLGNFEKEAQALEDCGYATHRDKITKELIYADKLIEVFNGRTMKKAIAMAEENAQCSIVNAIVKNSTGNILPNTEVLIKTNKSKDYIKKISDKNGIIEGITSDLNQIILFNQGGKKQSYQLQNSERKKSIALLNFDSTFIAQTTEHDGQPSPPQQSDGNNVNNDTLDENKSDQKSDPQFNLKFIEADTKRPIPSLEYKIRYKGNIKQHSCNTNGLDTNIKASVGENIEILVEGVTSPQLITCFPVTSSLNGQTQVIEIPTVKVEITLLNNTSTQPMVNYRVISHYRNNQQTKTTNNQGTIKIIGLAGQAFNLTVLTGEIIMNSVFDQRKPSYRYSIFKNFESQTNTDSVENSTSDKVPVANDTTANISQNEIRGENGHPTTIVQTDNSLELSGAQWASRFTQSTSLDSLKEPFRSNALAFVTALNAGGVKVIYNTTLRPPQRSYLMYYSKMVHDDQISPDKIPPFTPQNGDAPVNIQWVHTDKKGKPDMNASKKAAIALFKAYGIGSNPVGKPYRSNHNGGEAFDCRFEPAWGIGKTVINKKGMPIHIKTKADITSIGESYGVKHWSSYGEPRTGKKDDPHWSKTGN